ncbi:hypothetical protein ACFU99_30905 [Streptomyces sp. NPDC057654]|uniref:hypothetical protein n=1 Tax=Streptomyces sp. NPDC057654 TaxID=3346196 RepID=UPI003682C070
MHADHEGTPGRPAGRSGGSGSRPAEAAADADADADGTTVYGYGDAVLALTDRLNAAASYAQAAALLDQVVEPAHGLLERLAEFFEAAAEKAQEAAEDDGFDLAYDLADAAAQIRSLTEQLHVAEDRMRALTPPPPLHRPAAPAHALPPSRPALPPPRPRAR